MIIYRTEPITNEFIVYAINKKQQCNVRIQRLQNYYNDKHDILLRHYSDSTKPNNRIVVNTCKEIADFLTGYLSGVPIKYLDAPQVVTDILNYNDNDNTTQSINLSMNIAGFGVELFYMDEDGIPRFTSIDPKEMIFVLDDSLEQNITSAIRVYPKDDEAEGYNVTLYTSTEYINYSLAASVGQLIQQGKPVPHLFQDVPVILYKNNDNMLGSFEGIMSLQDALNKVISDEVNDFESFVDSYLVLEGMTATTSEDIAVMKSRRVLLTDPDSKAYWLTKQSSGNTAQVMQANLKRNIRELGNIPDIENLGSFGASGVALRFKLIKTETQAIKQERGLFKGIQRKLELLYNILSLTYPAIGSYTDIVPTFERSFIMEMMDSGSAYEPDPQMIVNTQYGRSMGR